MEYTYVIALSFLCGIVFHIIWNWVMNTGYSMMIMKRSINDCVIFMAKNLQNVYEIKYLKEEAMRLVGRDEKYIEWQAKVDQKEIDSLKSTCIRNFINSIPPKYNHLIEFRDWDSAMEYINKTIKEAK
tara:strand:+ start:655 stop:1038 length:384 start_codon:yes stop_codon:yes gene_type:complete